MPAGQNQAHCYVSDVANQCNQQQDRVLQKQQAPACEMAATHNFHPVSSIDEACPLAAGAAGWQPDPSR
jgi:hypothetical protein